MRGLVKFARSEASLDVWVGIVNAIIVLEICGNGKRYLVVTGGAYLLSRCDCSDQIEHKDSEVREPRRAGFFVLDFGLKQYIS